MSERSETRERTSIWTPANIVTVIRICFVPVFVVAILAPWPEWITVWPNAAVWKPWIAAFIFALLAATDGVDGYLARSRGEVTDFGKFIDPLADKILVTAALLVLIELGVLPSWIALIILAREFIVSGIRMLAATKGVVIAASWYGKAKTVTQIIAIIMFIIKDSVLISNASSALVYPLFVVSWVVMAAAVVLTIGSMLDYFVKAKDLLGFTKSSSGKASDAGDTDKAHGVDTSSSVAADADADGDTGVCAMIEASVEARSSETAVLAGEIVSLASGNGVTVATAESLTGGMIAAALTDIPGSSNVLKGGIVSYVDEVKTGILGVEEDVLRQNGAVSQNTAAQMADGARECLAVDFAVSATGLAGPDGDGSDNPVGTVWIAVSSETSTEAVLYHFDGNRDEVRRSTVETALSMLLSRLQRN